MRKFDLETGFDLACPECYSTNVTNLELWPDHELWQFGDKDDPLIFCSYYYTPTGAK